MFRAFQVKLDSQGAGNVRVGPPNVNNEWDIYQISLNCSGPPMAKCTATLFHNGFFLCASPQGWSDTATGPPNTLVRPGDALTVSWVGGSPGDIATAGVWYNENPVGSTIVGH